MPKSTPRDQVDSLVKKATKARTAKETNSVIDALAKKYGEDAVEAIQDVVDETRFDAVRVHGLQVIRDVKSEDTKF